MILSKQYLNEIKSRKKVYDSISIFESKIPKIETKYDIFLSYSIKNCKFAIMVYQLLKQCGYSVYIDLYDNRLNRNKVNKKTANILANAMSRCKGLLYLHSSAASVSKWCPWELGYFSGKKNFMCANIPLTEKKSDRYDGQEYLQIYKQIEYSKSTKGNYNFWVYDKSRHYVTLRVWLDGKWKEKKRK